MTSLAAQPWLSTPALTRIFDLLAEDGGEGRVVGGAVRNSLMGLEPGDIDIATTVLPEDVMARAKATGIKAVPTGLAHGTVTLVIDGKPYEVTTLRRDLTTDGRHAEVAFGTDWDEDARRRDLTVNALYVDRQGQVFDAVGGLADLEVRAIRFIGEAEKRIAEDHLRILRFFRFFAWYGSGRPDAEGLRACAKARDSLASLSAERVWAETKKLLSAPDPGRALLWMRQAGVLTAILPETEKWGIDAIPGLVGAEGVFGWPVDPMLRLAAIVPDNPERLVALATRLKLSKNEAALLDAYAQSPTASPDMAETAFDRLIYTNGPTGLTIRTRLAVSAARTASRTDASAMARVGHLSRRLERLESWQKPVFPLSGSDVKAAGIEPGPRIGEILGRLEADWLAGNFCADRAALLERLKGMV